MNVNILNNLDIIIFNLIIFEIQILNHGLYPIYKKRSALLTARYPIHTGLQTNVIAVAQPSGLHRNETLFPQETVRKLI